MERKMVRIGGTMINTDIMSADEMDRLADIFGQIAHRKRRAEYFMEQLEDLVVEARREGFDFVEKDLGNILTAGDWEIIDNE